MLLKSLALASAMLLVQSSEVLAADIAEGAYQALGAEAKRDYIWSKIEASEYSDDNLPTEVFGVSETLDLFKKKFLRKTFLHTSDEMIVGRKKLIHTNGSVAKVSLRITEVSPYSGVLATGSELPGLARLSLATPDGFTPGMGLKLLIDKKPSVNLLVMNNLNGQDGDTNFFRDDFSNKIPWPNVIKDPKLLALGTAFAKAINSLKWFSSPVHLSNSHLGAVKPDGGKVRNNHYPSQLIFKPAKSELAGYSIIESDSKVDIRKRLRELPEGIVLYHVYAKNERGNERRLGELVLESSFVPSKHGDQKLFFQHNI